MSMNRLTKKAVRKRQKRERMNARRRRTIPPCAPWIVAGALVTATMGRADLQAQAPALAASASPFPRSPAGDQPALRFEIPAGPLGEAVATFTRITGIRVELSEAMAAITAPGVSGTMRADQALEQLLSGTSLSFRFISSTLVALEFRRAEAVDVTGRTPPSCRRRSTRRRCERCPRPSR